jgi:hypothetical protein
MRSSLCGLIPHKDERVVRGAARGAGRAAHGPADSPGAARRVPAAHRPADSPGGRPPGCRQRTDQPAPPTPPLTSPRNAGGGIPLAETYPAPRAAANNLTGNYRHHARAATGGGCPGIDSGARRRPPPIEAAPRNHPHIGDNAPARGSAAAAQPVAWQRPRLGVYRVGTGFAAPRAPSAVRLCGPFWGWLRGPEPDVAGVRPDRMAVKPARTERGGDAFVLVRLNPP